MGETFDPERVQGFSFLREFYDWVESAILAVACMLLLFLFVGRIISVDGSSMEDTLRHADRLIVSRLAYEPEYKDIVVVTMPNSRHEPLIKRVIATGGQTVAIDFEAGTVSVDGVMLDETYTKEPTYRKFDLEFPLTVPEGHVFVMGDNRNNSWDSRVAEIGMVDERYILGRVLYRVMPYNQMGVPE
jgi:signal peptidase I